MILSIFELEAQMTKPATPATHVVGYHTIWTAGYVMATIVGTILAVGLCIAMVIYASSCYEQRKWPWELWMEHKIALRKIEVAEEAADHAHDETMERIRMGLINE